MKRKRISAVVCALAGASTLLFCSCASSENAIDETEVAIVEESTEATETVVSETESLVSSNEETEEAETETTEETQTIETQTIETQTDPYAGIDMESTLSGVDWIKTFDGIITEPKLVVFNDATNKKIILEEFQEVEFADDDTLAVYIPENDGEVTNYLLFDDVSTVDGITLLRKVPSVIRRGGYVSPTCIDITFKGEKMTLDAHLKLIG